MKRITTALGRRGGTDKSGTIVGPFMSELTGHPQLTPTGAAGAATRCSGGADLRAAPGARTSSEGSGTGLDRRGTAASSKSTCWSMLTREVYLGS